MATVVVAFKRGWYERLREAVEKPVTLNAPRVRVADAVTPRLAFGIAESDQASCCIPLVPMVKTMMDWNPF